MLHIHTLTGEKGEMGASGTYTVVIHPASTVILSLILCHIHRSLSWW